MEAYKIIVFGVVGSVVTYYDFRFRIIPDKLILLKLLMGLPFYQNVLWLLLYGSVMLIFAGLSQEALGGGDVKYIAAMALYLGSRTWMSLFLGSLFFCLAVIVLLVIRRISLKTSLPFGPFLAAGGILTLLGGDALWLMRLFSN